jgi:hypothetical protein
VISVRYDLNLYIKCKIVLFFKKLMKPNSVTAKLSNFVQTSYFEYRTAYLCVDAETCPALPLLKSLYACLHVALNFCYTVIDNKCLRHTYILRCYFKYIVYVSINCRLLMYTYTQL